MPLDGAQGPISQALLGQSSMPSTPPASAATSAPAQQPASAARPSPANQVPASPLPMAPPPPSPSSSTNVAPDDVFDQLSAGIQKTLSEVNTNQPEMGENPPPAPYLPPPPQTQPYNPIKSWGSPAMMLALVASAFTRRPMVTALNSASQVMTAMKQNNSEQQQAAFNAWKTSTANALQNYKYEMDQYNAILKSTQDDSRDQSAKLTALFSAFGKGGGAYAAWQQGGAAGLRDFMQKSGKAA